MADETAATAKLTRMRQITFDYAGARNAGDVVGNMSGIAIDGGMGS